jgi:estrone sulfotransferase
MRYLLANLLLPGEEWNITNIGRVIPDLHEDAPTNPVPTQPRILKSHKPFRPEYARVIYLYRDGRDVALSYYDFHKKLRDNPDDFPTFLSKMLRGEVPYGTWQDHVASWLFDDKTVDLLPVCYETLYQDTRAELERIGCFVGCQWSADDIQAAIDKSSFERFQRDYAQYKQETHWRKGFTGGVKGGPGKWREVFTPELNDMFWRYAGEIAGKLGYLKE